MKYFPIFERGSIISHSHTLFKASLISLCGMIFGMALIGGFTRLIGAGLSIVEWKPVTGLLPPLTPSEWIFEFSKYQNSPEFLKINRGMTLEGFKSIYFLEYIHRLWGRLLGLLLIIPTFLMVFKRQYRDLMPFLLTLWMLGLIQGIMGWFMVKSGLSQDPHVSPYRLTAHLFLGFIIFGVALWMTLMLFKDKFLSEQISINLNVLKKFTFCALFFVIVTAIFGALVAGLKAGLIYNTFPLMGENLIPREFMSQSPWWKDGLENPVSVQFLHRFLATTTLLFCIGLWLYQRKFALPPFLSKGYNVMILLILLQFSLGLLTLLFMVPLPFALLHQGVAFLVFGSLIYVLFLLSGFSRKGLRNESN